MKFNMNKKNVQVFNKTEESTLKICMTISMFVLTPALMLSKGAIAGLIVGSFATMGFGLLGVMIVKSYDMVKKILKRER